MTPATHGAGRGLRRPLAGLLAAALATLVLGASVVPVAVAAADPGEEVVGVLDARVSDAGLDLVVPVPASAEVDLAGVGVEVAGAPATATATVDDENRDGERTTVLAVDTATRGERLRETVGAVASFVETLPADVALGVVGVGEEADVVLEPTRDREAARDALLELEPSTTRALFDGVDEAVALLADSAAESAAESVAESVAEGSVVVVSTGPDTTARPLSTTLRTIEERGVAVDVVALAVGAGDRLELQLLAGVGSGEVVDADTPAQVTGALTTATSAYDRRVRVTAEPPAGIAGEQEVVVTMPLADGASLRASTRVVLAPARPAGGAAAAAATVVPPTSPGLDTATVLAWSGVAAVGLGLLGVLVALVATPRGPDQDERLRRQLQAYGVFGATPQEAATAQEESGGVGRRATRAVEQALASQAGLEAAVAARLDAAGMRLKPAEWLLLHGGIVIGSFTVLLLLGGGSVGPALLGLVVGAAGPWIFLGLKRSRRLKAFSSGMADTLQLMSGSLSAGLSLAQSIDTIVREGSEPIAGEFRRVVVESRLGVPIEDALAGVAQRMDSQDFEWVVMAIRIQREVGGNLAELLLQVAATLREREFLRRHVRALSAEGRLSAWILGGLPPGFLLYLTLTKPDYTSVLWTDPRGWIMLGGMAVLMFGGVIWMVKAAKVDF